MATIEKVAEELRTLNGITDLSSELMLQGFADLNVGNDKVVEELVAIKEVLNSFMNNVPETIVTGFDTILSNNTEALIDFEEKKELLRLREESGKTEEPEKVGKSGKGTFAKAFKQGKEEDLGDMFGLKAFQSTLGSTLGNLAQLGIIWQTFGKNLLKSSRAFVTGLDVKGLFKNVIPMLRGALSTLAASISTLARLFVPIVGTINGLIEAFSFFQNEGGGLGSKLMAGIEGFIGGFAEIVLAPIDFVMNAIGDFFGIEFLQRFSAVEEFKFMVELLFNAFEDFGQSLKETFDRMAKSPIGQGLKEMWDTVSSAVDGFKQSLIDFYNGIAKYVPGLSMIGEDTREKGPTSEDFKMERREAREAGRAARTSGLYDRNLMGDSKIDRDMVADAPTEQLKVILNEGDLSDDDHMFVYEEYKKREERASKTQKEITVEEAKTGANGMEIPSNANVVQKGEVDGTVVLSGKTPSKVNEGNTVPTALSRAPSESSVVVKSSTSSNEVSIVVGGAQENQELSEHMTVANTKYMDNLYGSTTNPTGGSKAVVVTDNSVTSNSTTVKPPVMIRPENATDRTNRLRYRGLVN